MIILKSVSDAKNVLDNSEIEYEMGDSPSMIKNVLFNVNRDVNEVVNDGGQFFVWRNSNSDNKYNGFLSDQLIIENRAQEIIKLSCLFPGRVIVLTDIFTDKEKESFADIKYLYDNCYEYLQNGMFHIWVKQLKSKKVNLDKNIKVLGKSNTVLRFLNSIQLRIPWLYNARPEDYIEIIKKNNMVFLHFKNQIDKLSKVALSQSDLTNTLAQEYTDALIEMKIALDKKRFELKRKSIQTVLGFAFTAIPFFIPSHVLNVDPSILATIFGATTLKSEIVPLVQDITEFRALKDNSVYSILFKWERLNK
ncbi:MAG TPA: hypothetical protein DEQ02_04710 [Ruminococcaceae bacterium]|nr:hypothetical protein [Oscillospiraceae bacterium]